MTRGKKSILVVALVLALCAAMLFGATVAWFTSTATTGENTIKVADYNVVLKYATTWSNNDGDWTNLTESGQLFTDSETALKPGDTTGVKYIKIINNNSYAIKATVDISTIAQTVTGTEPPTPNPTTDKLNLYALKNATGTNDTLTVQTAGNDGKYTLNNISIAANNTAIIAIQFKLPEEATTPSVSNTFTIDVKTEQVPTATTPTT